jgi:hypothetical protein
MSEASEIRLEAWQEVIGTFRGIAKEDFRTTVLLGNSRVIFYPESAEAKMIEEQLNGRLIGEKIAILRTDIPEKPVIVRTT